MNKIILFTILTCASFLNAQNCGVGIHGNDYLPVYQAPLNPNSVKSGNMNFIPITVYFVRNTDGSFSNNTSMDPFYQMMLHANRIFGEIGVQFYIDGNINYIDNTAYLNCTRGSQEHTDLLNNKNPNTANVWIVDGWQGSPASGYGGPGGVELASLTEDIAIHEFGHFLTLAHTFDTGNGVELVTRSGGNCSTAGDGVCDTDADPYGLTISQLQGSLPADSNCALKTNTMDMNGDVYTPPYSNYMSYYGGGCGFEFTPGQFTRMSAGYTQYHTSYGTMSGGGIVAEPTGVSVVTMNGYEKITWTNHTGATGTLIEVSSDGGTNWSVMNGVVASENEAILSDIPAGASVQFRLRHLNGMTYSSTVSHTTTYAHVKIPIFVNRASTAFNSIGEVVIPGTSVNVTDNLNSNYTLHELATVPEFIEGGSFPLSLKVKTDPGNGSFGYTYFTVFIDENADGDFDDLGEMKYHETSPNFQVNVTTNISISSSAHTGYTRMRIRGNINSSALSPTDTYNFSETEDFIIKLKKDSAPYDLTATYNPGTTSVDLAWDDSTSTENYIIERTMDGITFNTIYTSSSPTPRTYSDNQSLGNQQYNYRVKRQGGNLYSNEATANTPDLTASYCTPVSVNGCNIYQVSNFEIPSVSFANNTAGSCGATSAGYSDYYATNTINLTAGQTVVFNIENQGQPGLMYCSIYLDANQNGVFDAGETVFEHTGGSEVSTGSLNIPASAINGETRLRIRGYFNVIPNACDQSSYGETEDYKVVISGGKESMVIGAQVSNITETSMDISWQAMTNASPSGYTLLQSTDGTTFTPLTTVSNSTFTYQATGLTQDTKYYFQIIANGTLDSEPRTVWGTTAKSANPPGPTNSLDENDIEDVLAAYPNPFDNELTVKLFDQKGELEIINPLGQVVYRGVINGESQVSTKGWSPGIYYLKVVLGNEVRGMKMMKK